MKYAIIIPDGMADYPLAELGGRTPVEAAETPHLDGICREGFLGLVHTTCGVHPPGSDVATLCLLGFDPDTCYSGRAPLEAASAGLDLGPDDLAVRCNLVTVSDETLMDYSGGAIPTAEAHELIDAVERALGEPGIEFYPGVSYRNLLILRRRGHLQPKTFPPHDVMGRRLVDIYPSGEGSDLFRDLILRSQNVLESHPVNRDRVSRGLPPANRIWLWGAGRKPTLPRFHDRFGRTGAVIAAVDLVKGVGRTLGWQVIQVEGATGGLDTNYEGKAAAAIEALKTADLVCVHIEAPDEAGHAGNAREKVTAIERVDRYVIGPVRQALNAYPGWRLLVLPDHPTPVPVRTHVKEPVPFAICGTGIPRGQSKAFSEAQARTSDFYIERGYELMDYFLDLKMPASRASRPK
jgi:2,3-bisphosphoglycerate-independent phosphoglycerate mutase